MTLTRMPMRTAAAVTFTYALGYPIGNMAVHAMSPMAVLVVRFGLAGLILSAWAVIAKVGFPTGRKLGHVAMTGLLMQAVQFCALYFAIQHGAPAVLCAVLIAMNPVATALLAATFLRDRLTAGRIVALVLGVAAVLAACASRLIAEKGIDPAVLLLMVALVGLAAGGVYQQRFCADVDFRASTAVQNAVAFIPALILAFTTHFEVHDTRKAAFAVAGVVLLNAVLGVSLYVRAINLHGASAVAMLFCIIPAAAGVMSYFLLGERVDVGIGVGLVLGALACWLNARSSRSGSSDSGSGRSGGQERSDSGSGRSGGQERSDSGSGRSGGQERSDSGSGRSGGQERSDSGSGEEREDDPGRDGGRQNRVQSVHQATVAR